MRNHTVMSVMYHDMKAEELIAMLDNECKIKLTLIEKIINRIQIKQPTLSKAQIAIILTETFSVMRKYLILGIPISIFGLFSSMRLSFDSKNKISLKVILTTADEIKKILWKQYLTLKG